MSDHLEGKDWRELSEAASREQDPQKLMELIRALNKALERRERDWKDQNQTAPVTGALNASQEPENKLAA